MKQKSTWFDCGFGLAFMSVASWILSAGYLIRSVNADVPAAAISQVITSSALAQIGDLLELEDVVYEVDFSPAMSRAIMESLHISIPVEGDAAFVSGGEFGSTRKFFCHVGDSVVENTTVSIMWRQQALIASEEYEIPDDEGAPIGFAVVTSYFFAGKIATVAAEIAVLGLAVTTEATIGADYSISTTVLPIGEAISSALAGAYVLQMQEVFEMAAQGTGPPTPQCLPECECQCAHARATAESACAAALLGCILVALTIGDFLFIGTCMGTCFLLPPGLNAACVWGCTKVLAVKLAVAIGACMTLYGACMAGAHVGYELCTLGCG